MADQSGRGTSGNDTVSEGDWCERPAAIRRHLRREGICPESGRTPSSAERLAEEVREMNHLLAEILLPTDEHPDWCKCQRGCGGDQ